MLRHTGTNDRYGLESVDLSRMTSMCDQFLTNGVAYLRHTRIMAAWSCDTLGVTARGHAPAMIFIECAWCETEVAVDGLDATSVECPDCNVTVELAMDDPHTISIAA
jgi:hypothetical protein